jgi:hypothetical protein
MLRARCNGARVDADRRQVEDDAHDGDIAREEEEEEEEEEDDLETNDDRAVEGGGGII